jgi:hypothetical protein
MHPKTNTASKHISQLVSDHDNGINTKISSSNDIETDVSTPFLCFKSPFVHACTQILIAGSGPIGATYARLFVEAGYKVCFRRFDRTTVRLICV